MDTQLKIKKKDLRLAKRIKRTRRKANLTQEELADKTNMSVTFIGLLETAKRKPSLKTLDKIASALGVKTKDLIPTDY